MAPAGTGIVDPAGSGGAVSAGRCFYWLHVHANDGIIHIEAPEILRFSLGHFFDVWGQPLTGTRVAAYTGTVTAFVNGRAVTTDPARIPLSACEEIQLDVGVAAPPQSYPFPPGLGC